MPLFRGRARTGRGVGSGCFVDFAAPGQQVRHEVGHGSGVDVCELKIVGLVRRALSGMRIGAGRSRGKETNLCRGQGFANDGSSFLEQNPVPF